MTLLRAAVPSLLAMAALALPLAALAAEEATAPTSAAVIETLVVAGDPVPSTETRAPTTFAAVLDAQLYADHVKTVSDALAESAGTQVRRFGGLGSFSTVSIRGSSSNHVAIYLDGVPLSRASNETVNLGDLPIDSLDRIEVFRGQSPVGFGAAGLGGVVNLVTAQPTEEPKTEFKLAYGSFDTRKLTASHSQQLRGIDVLAHLAYLGSTGDFPYRERSTEPGTPPARVKTRRANNEIESVSTLLKAGAQVGRETRVDVTSDAFFKDQGVPGIGRSQSSTANLRELRALQHAAVTQTGVFGREIEFVGRGFAIVERQDFENRTGDLFGVQQDVRNETTVVGAGAEFRDESFARHVPSASIEIAREGFSAVDAMRPLAARPPQQRLRFTAVAQEQVEVFRDHLLFVPTLRYERLEDSFGPFTGELGRAEVPRSRRGRDLWGPAAGLQWRALAWLHVNGNIGRFERAPNLDELFGNRGFVQGNARLRPERGTNRDVGFRAGWCDLGWIDSVSAEYAYFNNDVEDLIVLVQLSQQFFRPENVGGARLRGHEATLRASFWRHFALDLNYTRQEALNQSRVPSQRGKQLPGRPRDEVYARLGFEREKWSLFYELNFIGANFLDRVNFRRVDRRELHAVGLGVTVHPALRIGFEARNLGDEQAEDVAGFPLPGRSFFGTIKVTL